MKITLDPTVPDSTREELRFFLEIRGMPQYTGQMFETVTFDSPGGVGAIRFAQFAHGRLQFKYKKRRGKIYEIIAKPYIPSYLRRQAS